MKCINCNSNEAQVKDWFGIKGVVLPCVECSNRLSSGSIGRSSQKRTQEENTGKKMKKAVGSHFVGDKILYYDGKERSISASMLKEIKSSVVTHEGEHLLGKQARTYMDKHSERHLGKDMSKMYLSQEISGYAR